MNIALFGVEILASTEGYNAGVGIWLWSLVSSFIVYQKTKKWFNTVLIFLIFMFASTPIPAINFILFSLILRWERGSKFKHLFTFKKFLKALGLFFLAFIFVGLNDFLIRLFLIDQEAAFYTVGALLFSSISVFLFAKSKEKSLYYAEHLRSKIYKAIFRASLWGTAGFLITAITYWGAALREGEGTYYAWWGAMFIGGYDFIRIAYKYLKEFKPILDKYAKEEQIYFENFYHILGRFLSQTKSELLDYLKNLGISNATAQSIYESLAGNFTQRTKEEYKEEMSINKAFEVLGISISKNVEAIKNAYRKLAKVFHPDVKKSGDAAKFIEINRAYERALAYAEDK